MFTQKSVIEHLRKITGEIKNTGLHLNRVVLFGSYAKNQQHKWSDIDVAFIADEFIGIGFEDTKLFSRIMIKYPKLNIQPRTYNTKDFTPDRDPFVEEILKNGIEIKTEESSENYALYHLMDKETPGKALKLKEAKAYYGKLKKKV